MYKRIELGQVWYLNVSIPDLCLLPYFEEKGIEAVGPINYSKPALHKCFGRKNVQVPRVVDIEMS